MNRYPYCQPLLVVSLGLSPSGEYLYECSTVRFSEWQNTVRMTRPRWKVALAEPLEGRDRWEGATALYEATPEKFKYSHSLAAVPPSWEGEGPWGGGEE